MWFKFAGKEGLPVPDVANPERGTWAQVFIKGFNGTRAEILQFIELKKIEKKTKNGQQTKRKPKTKAKPKEKTETKMILIVTLTVKITTTATITVTVTMKLAT